MGAFSIDYSRRETPSFTGLDLDNSRIDAAGATFLSEFTSGLGSYLSRKLGEYLYAPEEDVYVAPEFTDGVFLSSLGVPGITSQDLKSFGVDIPKYDRPVSTFELMHRSQTWAQEVHRRRRMAQAPEGLPTSLLMLGAGMAGDIFEPTNLGVSFLLPHLAVTSKLVKGASAVRTWKYKSALQSTTKTRLKLGAAEGLFGSAVTEPFYAMQQRYKGVAPYTVADSIVNILAGTVASAGLRVAGGSVRDYFGRRGFGTTFEGEAKGYFARKAGVEGTKIRRDILDGADEGIDTYIRENWDPEITAHDIKTGSAVFRAILADFDAGVVGSKLYKQLTALDIAVEKGDITPDEAAKVANELVREADELRVLPESSFEFAGVRPDEELPDAAKLDDAALATKDERHGDLMDDDEVRQMEFEMDTMAEQEPAIKQELGGGILCADDQGELDLGQGQQELPGTEAQAPAVPKVPVRPEVDTGPAPEQMDFWENVNTQLDFPFREFPVQTEMGIKIELPPAPYASTPRQGELDLGEATPGPEQGELEELPLQANMEDSTKAPHEMTSSEFKQSILDANKGRLRMEHFFPSDDIIAEKVGSSKPEDVWAYYVEKYPELADIKFIIDKTLPEGARGGAIFLNKGLDFDTGEMDWSKVELVVAENVPPSSIRHEIEHALDALSDTKEERKDPSWKWTFDKFKRYDHEDFDFQYSHRQLVKQALERGDRVPEHVLAEYPDLGGGEPKPTIPANMSRPRKLNFKEAIEGLRNEYWGMIYRRVHRALGKDRRDLGRRMKRVQKMESEEAEHVNMIYELAPLHDVGDTEPEVREAVGQYRRALEEGKISRIEEDVHRILEDDTDPMYDDAMVLHGAITRWRYVGDEMSKTLENYDTMIKDKEDYIRTKMETAGLELRKQLNLDNVKGEQNSSDPSVGHPKVVQERIISGVTVRIFDGTMTSMERMHSPPDRPESGMEALGVQIPYDFEGGEMVRVPGLGMVQPVSDFSDEQISRMRKDPKYIFSGQAAVVSEDIFSRIFREREFAERDEDYPGFGFVEAMPSDTFLTPEEYHRFIMEHEAQHAIGTSRVESLFDSSAEEDRTSHAALRALFLPHERQLDFGFGQDRNHPLDYTDSDFEQMNLEAETLRARQELSQFLSTREAEESKEVILDNTPEANRSFVERFLKTPEPKNYEDLKGLYYHEKIAMLEQANLIDRKYSNEFRDDARNALIRLSGLLEYLERKHPINPDNKLLLSYKDVFGKKAIIPEQSKLGIPDEIAFLEANKTDSAQQTLSTEVIQRIRAQREVIKGANLFRDFGVWNDGADEVPEQLRKGYKKDE